MLEVREGAGTYSCFEYTVPVLRVVTYYFVVLNRYICVCVCFLPIHSGHQIRWMYQPGSQQEEGHTGFLIHLLSAVRASTFPAKRIQPFLSLVNREVEFCVLGTGNVEPKNSI